MKKYIIATISFLGLILSIAIGCSKDELRTDLSTADESFLYQLNTDKVFINSLDSYTLEIPTDKEILLTGELPKLAGFYLKSLQKFYIAFENNNYVIHWIDGESKTITENYYNNVLELTNSINQNRSQDEVNNVLQQLVNDYNDAVIHFLNNQESANDNREVTHCSQETDVGTMSIVGSNGCYKTKVVNMMGGIWYSDTCTATNWLHLGIACAALWTMQ